jgi:uncharacterized protein (TIGR04206 family)
MTWVRSEYAGALAVLSTWVVSVLPWSVSVLSPGEFTQVVLRFQWFVFRFLFGVQSDAEQRFQTVVGAVSFPDNPAVRQANLVWIVAAAVMTALLAFSVAYYLQEERVEELPVDPVRLTGGALLLAGVLHGVAFGLLWTGRPGLTVPVGLAFELLFAGVLLTVDRE